MQKVLITGADGFIGRHLVDKLLDEGKVVYGTVYPGNNVFEGKEICNLHIKSLDLNNVLACVDDFPLNEIDTMYHLAWVGVRPEERTNFDLQMRNVTITLNCIKMAEKLGIKRIVFPGSTNEYLYYGKPLNKDAVPSPSNAYGATKIALRYLGADFARDKGIDFIYTIITGIYSADRTDDNVIYYTINKLLKRERPALTRLEQLWDYVYIDDVIEALFLVGEKGKGGAVYAIGHGDNWKLSEYIRIIHKLIDASLPLGIGDIPYTGDALPCSCIDLTDIMRDTGYSPTVSFEDGISRVINKVRGTLLDD